MKKLLIATALLMGFSPVAYAGDTVEFIKNTSRGAMVLASFDGTQFTAEIDCKNRKVWMSGERFESVTVEGDPANYQMSAFKVWGIYCKSK